MSLELVRVTDLADLTDEAGKASYAYAARVSGGSLVLTAGACPLDETGVVGPVGDHVGQAQRVVANLVAALEAADARLEDVARTTVYVVARDRDDLVAVWGVVRAAFGDHDPPSTLVGVSLLGYEDQLVEVEAIAVV